MAVPLKSLGLCLGASTVSMVHVELDPHADPGGGPRIVAHSLNVHEGDPKRTLRRALEDIDVQSFDRIAATGRKFRKFVNLTSIPEPEAVEYAYPFVKPAGVDCPAVVSAGGETFMAYVLDRSGRIANVVTGNKCASGTGEFFLQQLRRMNVGLEDAVRFAAVETPHLVSGRCSVFCKSDCTHATNKGIPRAQVTAGLCQMMANKILELLKKVERRSIMITGGTARNRMMIECLRREIPGLVVPEQAPYFEALGAALWALSHETAPFPGFDGLFVEGAAFFDRLPPLEDFPCAGGIQDHRPRDHPAGGCLPAGPRRRLDHHQVRPAAPFRSRAAGIGLPADQRRPGRAPPASATARFSIRCGRRWTRGRSTSSAWA